MPGLWSRIKTWTSTENVVYSDLNAEFDNILTNFVPLMIDDYSTNATQMKVQTDPGEVGTESLATTLAGELARLRYMLAEVTGETYWYTSPSNSLAGISAAIGTGLPDNRLVSGRVLTTSAQPAFLVPNGAARTVKLDGTPTNFVYFIEGTSYTISSDVTATNLTAAPSSNNTCLVNDTVAADQYWTKYAGEDGSEIPVDNMGSEISALVGSFAGFKIAGTTDEYFIAYVDSSTRLTKARRGYFFDSADAPIPRAGYSNNDTITLMKLTWVFAQADGTLTVTYTNPVWSDDEPSSPAINDFWFDLSTNVWKKYAVSGYADADATLVGICIQDATNTVAARSFEFFKAWGSLGNVELLLNSNTVVKSRRPGVNINSWGTTHKFEQGLISWDITADLETGVTEAASTYYYFYVTDTGDKVISDKKPYDRREDLQGYYHPHQSWRCVGHAFNDGSSNLGQVESYFRSRESDIIRSVAATDQLLPRDRVIVLSGASFSEHLPPAALSKGNIYTFIHSGTSLSQVYTLDGNASETIGGSTTVAMQTAGQVLKIISDGSNWLILDSKTQTAWTSYTPVPGGFGTCTNMEVFWMRIGDSMRVRGSFLSGTAAAAAPTIPLPTGAVLDTAKMSSAKRCTYGIWIGSITTTAAQLAVTTRGPWAVTTDDAVTDSVLLCQDVDKDNDAADQVFVEQNYSGMTDQANTSWQMIDFTVPISGWLP